MDIPEENMDIPEFRQTYPAAEEKDRDLALIEFPDGVQCPADLRNMMKAGTGFPFAAAQRDLIQGKEIRQIAILRNVRKLLGRAMRAHHVDQFSQRSQEKVFYRGVFHCSGDLKLATNLEDLKIYVPADSDEIIVIGDFAYTSSLITETFKKDWLMRGRRETEISRGPDETHLKTASIEVELGKESENEEKPENDNWDKLSKVADKFDFMKINSDEMIRQLIRIMLQPTGKTVKFRCDDNIEKPKGQITTLKNYIDEYNLEIDKRKEQHLLSAGVE